MIRIPFWLTCVIWVGLYMLYDMHQKLVPESQPFLQLVGFIGAICLVLYWIYVGCCWFYDKNFTPKDEQ